MPAPPTLSPAAGKADGKSEELFRKTENQFTISSRAIPSKENNKTREMAPSLEGVRKEKKRTAKRASLNKTNTTIPETDWMDSILKQSNNNGDTGEKPEEMEKERIDHIIEASLSASKDAARKIISSPTASLIDSSKKRGRKPTPINNVSKIEVESPKAEEAQSQNVFVRRRSRRQSICVDKFTPDTSLSRPKAKSVEKNNGNKHCWEIGSMKLVAAEIKKRSRDSSCSSENKSKRRKLNVSVAAAADKEPIEVIDEFIEDIWHVSVMTVNKEPVMRFLVKWDGFAPSENTLEPYEHVSDVLVLREYVQRKFDIHQDKIDFAIQQLSTDAEDLFDKYRAKPKNFILKKASEFDELFFKCNILAYIYTYEKIPQSSQFMRQLRYQTVISKFYKKMKQEQEIHKERIQKIIVNEGPNFRVTIENNINFRTFLPFKYRKSVDFPVKGNMKGCKCTNGCSKTSDCCPKQKGLEFVYDGDARLCASSHQMIVECNDFCSCDLSCPNRPKKSKASFCVFKTADRGWALKTMEAIPAGTFVIEYTGELIDQQEALKRSSGYNKNVNNYLFDLDYNETGEATYSIDATNEGNLSRFINHSCQANLQTWPAMSCNESSKLHRLYYFSLRPIKAGEELTVDYSGGVLNASNSPSKHAIPCKCKSPLCKGFMF